MAIINIQNNQNMNTIETQPSVVTNLQHKPVQISTIFCCHNLQHFLSAVYNTSEYKLNRGAHKEFTTQIYKPKQLTDSFKTIGSKCDTDQEYLALTKRFIT